MPSVIPNKGFFSCKKSRTESADQYNRNTYDYFCSDTFGDSHLYALMLWHGKFKKQKQIETEGTAHVSDRSRQSGVTDEDEPS